MCLEMPADSDDQDSDPQGLISDDRARELEPNSQGSSSDKLYS